ncbi:MAG: hypothetical protein GQ546_09255 [Gammaproteobacteria bacterium]|nr:hypothetical protein [Gammaproteobacteria bacterium]
MKDLEKLLLWFIPLFILEYIVNISLSWLLTESAGAIIDNKSQLAQLFKENNIDIQKVIIILSAIKPLLAFATKIAVAIWLFLFAKKHDSKPFLWAFFGAVTGVVSIAIFYAVLIFEKQELSENNKFLTSQ